MKLFKTIRAALAALVVTGAVHSFAATEAEHDALIALAKEEGSEFEARLALARESGMAEDWLLEAELIRALSTSDVEQMIALLPRIEAAGEAFRYGMGRDFYSARQLEGFADTLHCVIAYQSGDREVFERRAVDSFIKAPGFNRAFGIAELLARHRMEEAQLESMADFSVPMDMELASVDGERRTLKEWMGGSKAMLVDFWASWCGPCIRLMPSLKEKEASLSEQGVFVAGINTDRGEQQSKAERVRAQHDMESVPWLLDRNGGDLSGMLMIDSIPRMVLIDREGKVLYNGHPMDQKLGVALAAIGVELGH